MEPTDKKLLDHVRDAIRLKHCTIRTQEGYTNWTKRYSCFHIIRHPAETDGPQVLGHPWGVNRMMARLFYGFSLRLTEWLRLLVSRTEQQENTSSLRFQAGSIVTCLHERQPLPVLMDTACNALML